MIAVMRGGDGRPSLSLHQLAQNAGIPFEQCPECNGRGWARATLLASMVAIRVLAKACPNEPVPVQYDRCSRCQGDGGWWLT